MAKNEILITKEGLDKLKAELKDLKEVRRPEVITRIKLAKELGDLSENAEYSAAKDEQSFIEGRIQELEEILKHTKLVKESTNGHKTVDIGCKVKVEVESDEDTFEIVGPTESDPANGRISTGSPVGKALIGHKAGDKVTVSTPDGNIIYTIVSVA